jgi:predicted GNAT family acetyltransferase
MRIYLDPSVEIEDQRLGRGTDSVPPMAVTVDDNREEHRFEVRSDGELAGFTIYESRPGLIVFIHTEIDQRFEGQGLGSTLVAGALDAARRDGQAVLPSCPFVNGYIERHPEYRDLVREEPPPADPRTPSSTSASSSARRP